MSPRRCLRTPAALFARLLRIEALRLARGDAQSREVAAVLGEWAGRLEVRRGG